MQNFIVLGYIPGTQIQITFQGWLWIVACMLISYILVRNLANNQSVKFALANISVHYQEWLSEPVIVDNRSVY